MASDFRWRFSFLKLLQNHGPSTWIRSCQHPACDSCWIICDANSPTATLNHSITILSWIETCVGFPYQKSLHELLLDTWNTVFQQWHVLATTLHNGSGPSQISWKCVNCVSNFLQPGMSEMADLDFWVATQLSYCYIPCCVAIAIPWEGPKSPRALVR